VQDAPDVNVVWSFNVEDEKGKGVQRPRSKVRKVKLVTKAGGSGRWMSGDVIVGPFQAVDESERGVNSMLFEVIVNCLFHIFGSQSPRDDGLIIHDPE